MIDYWHIYDNQYRIGNYDYNYEAISLWFSSEFVKDYELTDNDKAKIMEAMTSAVNRVLDEKKQ